MHLVCRLCLQSLQFRMGFVDLSLTLGNFFGALPFGLRLFQGTFPFG